MAITTCPDCGNDVSTLAQACVNCGRPMDYKPPNDALLSKISSGERVSCPDGSCTGIIGLNGECRTCGKDYTWSVKENQPVTAKTEYAIASRTARKCRSCGYHVDISAKSCPNCGCTNPGLSNNWMAFSFLVAIGFGLWVWLTVNSCTKQTDASLERLEMNLKDMERTYK